MNPRSVGSLDDTSTWPNQQKDTVSDHAHTPATPDEPKEEGIKEDENWAHLGEAQESGKVSSSELIHQTFLLNPDILVRDLLLQTGITVKDFVRFEVGEDLKD